MHRFTDRSQAGSALVAPVRALGLRDPAVLALPRGGVVVAAELAAALGAPLDVLVVRKIGLPGREEYGVGAIAEGAEVPVLHDEALALHGLTPADLAPTVAMERRELERRVARYRGGRPPQPVDGRAVVLVDDGVATGVTALAALRALRAGGAARRVLAVPVGAADSLRALAPEADDIVCVVRRERFGAVGNYYERFDQVGDEEVLQLLAAGASAPRE
ncbi:MAG: sle [Mycobacterium sp.]|nr:sle [Mycobacterium sp.]